MAHRNASTTLLNSAKQPISGVLDNPPAVLSDLGIDQGAQVILELGVRALFVQTGQAAVASHIGSQDGGKASLYPLRDQECSPGLGRGSLRLWVEPPRSAILLERARVPSSK